MFPKVRSCAGTKWFFSHLCSTVAMYYTPPNKHFKITLKLFHIQSPTESIADKLSLFLILRPTPPGRRLQLQSVAVSLVRDEM